MEERFYHNLKKQFSKIGELFSAPYWDEDAIASALGELKFSRKQLEKHARGRERGLLLYCIDTLAEIAEEGSSEKAASFAALVQDMPDIFLGERNFYSFTDEIKCFRNKYGNKYFKKMRRIHPYFSRKMPKNAAEYFSADSDEEFKRQHPIGYVVLVITGVAAFLLPLMLYTVYLSLRFSDAGVLGGWPFLAIFGCLVMGIGMFNIVAAFIHQYLGHMLTLITFAVGGAAIGFSIFMTENQQLYNPTVSMHYFISLLLLVFNAIIYIGFRYNVGDWLERTRKIKSSQFSRMTKGWKNYWWYKRLHEECGLGAVYYLNKIFTLLFALTLTATSILGLIKYMTLITGPMNILLNVVTAVMSLVSCVMENKEKYGVPFVLLRKRSTRGYDSVIIDLGIVVLLLFLAYVNATMLADIWGISLPKITKG